MKPRLVITGDSFVEGVGGRNGGWAQMLARRLPDIVVDIYGIGGQTTRDLKGRIGQEIGNASAVVVIGIGVNDSRSRTSLGHNEVPIDDFAANSAEIIRRVVNAGARALVVGLTTVDETHAAPFKEDKFYRNATIHAYDRKLRAVCAQAGADYVALPPLADHAGALSDGLHPSDKGHRIILKSVEPVVKRLLS